jgi:hypothetical protein
MKAHRGIGSMRGEEGNGLLEGYRIQFFTVTNDHFNAYRFRNRVKEITTLLSKDYSPDG